MPTVASNTQTAAAFPESCTSPAALRERTRDVLSHEIAFIPCRAFREMDADELWRKEMASLVAHTPVSDVEAVNRPQKQNHVERLCAAPLLERQQERDLFCWMNYLKYRANVIRSTLNVSRPSVRKLAQIESFLSRANQLRNHIVNSNTRLTVSIVKKYANENHAFDELLSEGINCLIKAVEKFDVDRGFRFSTYATLAIRREIFRLIERTSRDRTRFTTGNGEVLDKQIGGDGEAEQKASRLSRIRHDVKQLLTHLDEREQYIVTARFGFVDVGMRPTFANLGHELGISKERVRQLQARAINKLRDLIDVSEMVEWREHE